MYKYNALCVRKHINLPNMNDYHNYIADDVFCFVGLIPFSIAAEDIFFVQQITVPTWGLNL